MKYIKKPLIVEAFRYGHDPYPDWYIEALCNKKVIHKENILGCSDVVIIKTLEGEMRAYTGAPTIKVRRETWEGQLRLKNFKKE